VLRCGHRPYIAAARRTPCFLLGLDYYKTKHSGWSAALAIPGSSTRLHVLSLGGRQCSTLLGYCDCDYANSVRGRSFILSSDRVSWSLRKQPTMANSSCFAEYKTPHTKSSSFARGQKAYTRPPCCPSDLLCNTAVSRLMEDHV
jgi:hypothetical protein